MQLGEMQHFNTTPLVEIQPGEMQFEMQLSQFGHFVMWCILYVAFYNNKIINNQINNNQNK